MNDKNNRTKKLRTIACFAIIAAYLAGFVLMFFDRMSQGTALWVLSTFAGIALLYFKRKNDEETEEMQKQDAEEAN